MQGQPVKRQAKMIPSDVLGRKIHLETEKKKEMKQEFDALFKAFRGREHSGERRLREENEIALPKGIKGIIRAFSND